MSRQLARGQPFGDGDHFAVFGVHLLSGCLLITDYFILFTVSRRITLTLNPNVFAVERGDTPSGAGEEKNSEKNGHSPAPYGFSPRAPLPPLPHRLVRFFSLP